jgi:hypothetical protein
MLVLFVYLVGILHSLNFVLGIVALLSVAGSLFFFCILIDLDSKEDKKECREVLSPIMKVAFISVSLFILMPSEDTAYRMAAAYGVTEAYEVASQSEDVKRLAGKSLELLEKHMDEALKED